MIQHKSQISCVTPHGHWSSVWCKSLMFCLLSQVSVCWNGFQGHISCMAFCTFDEFWSTAVCRSSFETMLARMCLAADLLITIGVIKIPESVIQSNPDSEMSILNHWETPSNSHSSHTPCGITQIHGHLKWNQPHWQALGLIGESTQAARYVCKVINDQCFGL